MLPRTFRSAAITIAIVLAVAVLTIPTAATIYVAHRIDSGALQPDRDGPTYPFEVVSSSGDEITLRGVRSATLREGIWGLEWDGGYGKIGEVVRHDSGSDVVVRKFIPINGTPTVGMRVRFDSFSFPDTPASRGLPFNEVTYPAPGGPTPAWLLPGSNSTWAIFVHGKGSSRAEALRILPVFIDAGVPSLVIEYRNDADAPGGQSGRFKYGATEWEDLQSAVAYAVDAGAVHVILVGYSMGGGIVMSFAQHSPLASRVSGMILDAPMLDFGATVEFALQDGGVPDWFTGSPKWLAGIRYGIDWRETDYLSDLSYVSRPILLFHTTGDDTVPVSTSDELASRLNDLVTYIRTEGSGHVRSWNLRPEEYEDAVRLFLSRVTAE